LSNVTIKFMTLGYKHLHLPNCHSLPRQLQWIHGEEGVNLNGVLFLTSVESMPNKATLLFSSVMLLKGSTLQFLISMCIISTVEMSQMESRNMCYQPIITRPESSTIDGYMKPREVPECGKHLELTPATCLFLDSGFSYTSGSPLNFQE
jgi:hypothetical protein